MVKEVDVHLNLAERLASDKEFCKEFFRIHVQHDIAEQIIFLRNKRQLRQIDLAERSGMKQSAVSRIEQADYASWNYQTLVRVVEALDARIKVRIEPLEEAILYFKETDKEDQEWKPPIYGASGDRTIPSQAITNATSQNIRDNFLSLVA